jgi:hypothetical protein
MQDLSGNNATLSKEPEWQAELSGLNAKVNAILPLQYQYCFEAVNPRSMGSAALKYDSQSRVAWDQIWTLFCDLALAGGPPHRGTLLESPTAEEVEAEPAGYFLVCEELTRGIRMTSGLPATVSSEPGWLTVECQNPEMADWLLRAILAENVFVRRQQETAIQVPAGPAFRLAKEVKNVVVALAKTCHYWQQHLSRPQQQAAARLFAEQAEITLFQPPSRGEALSRMEEYREVALHVGQALEERLGVPAVRNGLVGWIGLQFPDERTAAWFVRSAIVENILARREEQIFYLPVPEPGHSRQAAELIARLDRLHHLSRADQVQGEGQ